MVSETELKADILELKPATRRLAVVLSDYPEIAAAIHPQGKVSEKGHQLAAYLKAHPEHLGGD